MNRLERMYALCQAQPSNAFAWYSLAMELRKSNLPQALEVFGQLQQNHPDYLPAYYHHGKTLEDAERPEDAKSVYRQGIVLAQRVGDGHALGELETALDLL